MHSLIFVYGCWMTSNCVSAFYNTDELGYDGPLYDGLLHMTDDMLGPSMMQINY